MRQLTASWRERNKSSTKKNGSFKVRSMLKPFVLFQFAV